MVFKFGPFRAVVVGGRHPRLRYAQPGVTRIWPFQGLSGYLKSIPRRVNWAEVFRKAAVIQKTIQFSA